jgi:hypothetical protein
VKETEIKKLSDEIERSYKYYHGWHFFTEYQGLFVYAQMGGDIAVYCTPDYDGEGALAIQVTRPGDGAVVESASIPYTSEVMTAWEFFRLVKPYLDKHAA